MPMPNYNYFPQNYQPMTYQSQPLQIQNGGLISVRNEMEARNYPIASGTSITFKDESQPYVYVKTMGFSQLDRPTFEKFRLIKEDATETTQMGQISTKQQESINLSDYVLKTDFEALRKEFEAFKDRFNFSKKEEVKDE